MLKVVLIVAILATPALVGGLAILGARLWQRTSRWHRRRRSAGVPAGLPLERIAADLRRLRLDVIRIEEQPDLGPGRQVRLGALRAAYTDSLRAACAALDAPLPETAGRARLSDIEVYRLEAVLRERGLDVRPVALR